MKKVVSIMLVLAMVLPMGLASATVANQMDDSSIATAQTPLLADFEGIQDDENLYERFIVRTQNDVTTLRGRIDDAGISVDFVDDKYASSTGYSIVTLGEAVSYQDFVTLTSDFAEFVQPDYKLEIAALSDADTKALSESVSENLAVFNVAVDIESNLGATHENSTGADVIIALIDTGVDLSHEDLMGKFVSEWDFLANDSVVSASGTSWGELHGTHIAGIIARVAPDSLIMPLCTFDEGQAYTSDVIAAIKYAETNGAKIVNCSWGCEEDNPALRDTIETSNMLFVAAAGNNGSDLSLCPVYPAAYTLDNVISVASIDEDGELSNFSNYGKDVDIAAYGRNIVSTTPDNSYSDMTGTSVSAAFVSGAAARAVSGGMDIQEAKRDLKASANKVNSLRSKIDDGNVLGNMDEYVGVALSLASNYDVATLSDDAAGWDEFAKHTIKEISCGDTHTVVLMTDGTVWTWGENSYGELGIGTSDDHYHLCPQKVSGLSSIKSISAGSHNTLAVNSLGYVYGWGYNAYGQMGNGTTLSSITYPQKSDITGVSSAKLSSYNGLFLKSGGSVWATGYNLRGVLGDGTYGSSTQSTPKLVSGLSNIKSIDVSTFSAAAVTTGGSAYVWGTMGSDRYLTPTALLSGQGISDVKTGNNMLVAVSTDGDKVWQWDHFPASYEITNGQTSYGTGQVTQISAGNQHYLLLMADGTIYAGGSNSQGQFGNGINYGSSTTKVLCGPSTSSPAFSNVKAISSANHSNTNLAWTDDGGLWVWGGLFYTLMGNDGVPTAKYPQQIGDTITEVTNPDPVTVPYGIALANLLSLPKTVSAKLLSGSMVDVDVTWSSGNYDPELIGTPQIVTGSIATPVRVVNRAELEPELTITVKAPQAIVGVNAVAPIYAAYQATWDDLLSQLPATVEVQLEDGSTEITPVVWDESTYDSSLSGEAQTVSGALASTPAYTNWDDFTVGVSVTVALAPMTSVDAGYLHSLALRSDGTVWAWGDNTYGQLGDGTNESKVLPQQVPGLSNVKLIAAGYYHNIVYCNDGTLWQWGRNIGNIPQRVSLTDTNIKDVKAGLDYTLVRSGEKLYGWGANDKGQLGIGRVSAYITTPRAILSNFDRLYYISAGAEHTLVASSLGDVVYGWGYNSCGELGEANIGENVLTPQVVTTSETLGDSVRAVRAGNQTSLFGSTIGVYSLGRSMVQSSKVDLTPVKITDSRIVFPYYLDLGDSIGIDAYSRAKTFGDNTYGQRGNSAFSSALGSGNVYKEQGSYNYLYTGSDCAAGGMHVIVRDKNDDSVYWAWGCNSSGQLGDGTTYNSCNPIEVGKPRYVKSVDQLEQTMNVAFGTQADDLELPTELNVLINGGVYIDVPVVWDTSEYDGQLGRTAQIIEGTFVLPENVVNSSGFEPAVTINVGKDPNEKDIIAVTPPEPFGAPFDTAANKLRLPSKVSVTLEDNSQESLDVTWDTSSYDSTKTDAPQIIPGELILKPGIANPDGLTVQVEVTVSEIPPVVIESVIPLEIETWQNLMLGPTDREHSLGGEFFTETLPETAWVKLSNGESLELPVVWEIIDYDSTQPQTYTYFGDYIIDEDSDITNPDGLRAQLKITVIPKEYLVVETEVVSISALIGTDIDGLNDILIQENKNELDVWALDEDWMDAFISCNIVIAEDQGSAYDMSTPGEYILTALMPENFLNFESDVNEVQIFVTVLESSDIVQAEASMDYYQSAAREDLSNIPTQATVTLENGYTILSDVEWDWGTFNKDYVGEQIVLGTLVNIPAAAKQPDGQEIKATMVVNVVPMQYRVTGVEDNVFTASAGLTLDEVNAILAPTVTLEITSTADGADFSTEYPIGVTLEMGTSAFDPEYADEYTFMGLYELPDNIVWPETVANEIYLTTTPVEIIEVEELYGAAGEGQEFDELELPTQVMVTLSCAGIDGENKKVVLDVDWGTGEGYSPVPDVWNDDGTATLVVTGTIANCPQYISNGDETLPTVEITMIPAPNLVLISPSRIPALTALEVKVGSTLEDIYAAIDSHTVQLTLEDYQGNQYSADMTFALRLEENPHYDSMTQGTYTLYAYLPLGNVIKNPDSLNVRVVVKTMQYTIFSTQTTPWTSTVGTAFEDLGLPEKATIVRNDKKTEELDVTWDGTKYNSTKIGNQVISGTLDTPLPAHLTNPSNRQPKVLLTLVDPDTQILSLTQVTNEPMPVMLFSLRNTDEGNDSIPGFTEYLFWAELQHKDGTVTTEMISVFVETAENVEDNF